MFSTFEYENVCFFVAKDSQLPFMLQSKLDAGTKIGRFTPPSQIFDRHTGAGTVPPGCLIHIGSAPYDHINKLPSSAIYN